MSGAVAQLKHGTSIVATPQATLQRGFLHVLAGSGRPVLASVWYCLADQKSYPMQPRGATALGEA